MHVVKTSTVSLYSKISSNNGSFLNSLIIYKEIPPTYFNQDKMHGIKTNSASNILQKMTD